MPMNNATGSRTWTPEQDEHLKQLWSEGHSGGDIAWEMGKTRNAVIGRAHRLKLPGRIERRPVHQIMRPQGRGGQKGNPGQAKAKGIVSRVRARALADRQHAGNEHFRPGALPPEREEGVDVSHLIGIMGLGSTGYPTQCRWIHGEAGADAKFCGKPTRDGSSWCDEHKARVHKRAAAD